MGQVPYTTSDYFKYEVDVLEAEKVSIMIS